MLTEKQFKEIEDLFLKMKDHIEREYSISLFYSLGHTRDMWGSDPEVSKFEIEMSFKKDPEGSHAKN